MNYTTTQQLLHTAQQAKQQADQAQRTLLATTVAWCHAHRTDHHTNPSHLAYWPGTNQQLTLAGPGAPTIYETAVHEYAAALGYHPNTARAWLADALELAHRLPRIYAQINVGNLPVWRARRITQHTHHLPLQAATYIDQHLAHYAHKATLAQIERTISQAKTRYCPNEQQDHALTDREHRHVTIDPHTTPGGTTHLQAALDTADAYDLDTALRREAHLLTQLGSTQPLNTRRALGLGNLARRQLTLDLTGTPPTPHRHTEPYDEQNPSPSAALDTRPGAGPNNGLNSGPNSGPEVLIPATTPTTLYFHIRPPQPSETPHHASPHDQGPVLVGSTMPSVWLANGRGAGLDLDAFVMMLHDTNARVTVKPVIDLNTPIQTTSYQPTPAQIEHLYLRDEHCVFPFCTRPARPAPTPKQPGPHPSHGTDADHITPWPQGKTTTDNLAPLCRTHHRAKTHHGWAYHNPQPGHYTWTSPLGHTYQTNTNNPDP